FGSLITSLGLGLLTLLGVGLAFDLTGADLQAFAHRLKESWQTLRIAERETSADATNISQGVAISPLTERPAQPPAPPTSDAAAPPTKAEKPVAARSPRRRRASSHALPPLSLLQASRGGGVNDAETRRKSRIIEETLSQFGIPAKVTEVRIGPTVTQFGLTPGYLNDGSNGTQERKVRINQITALTDDLALALAARTLRIEAPVPGQAIVGIEVPNDTTERVTLRRVLDSQEFKHCSAPLCFAVGLNVAGSAIAADLATMPHLLIAGTTGSGKSVFVKSLAASLIMRNTPQELRLIALDPKIVELSHLNGLPHLLGTTETETERMLRVLRWTAVEMDNRYKEFEQLGARNLDHYNRKAGQQGQETKPRIVVLIDELADLMMAAPDETERTLTRLAQMARATGIHLVVATQRPSTDVVTGLIKANFPARVSFATASNVDSRVILDTPGADSLLGRGDMLFLPPDVSAPRRIQGCFISEEELSAIIEFWQLKEGTPSHAAPWDVAANKQGPQHLRLEGASTDATYLEKALQMARSQKKITTSGIQRQLHISYPRAARLMGELEAMGAVGPQRAAGRKRRVLLGDESE
ncbi:MAG: DNA translocase FtsK, partial [Chloroflexota bacterium]|nr:DNA translocase FtsK [Chloroflexota bacterium]